MLEDRLEHGLRLVEDGQACGQFGDMHLEPALAVFAKYRRQFGQAFLEGLKLLLEIRRRIGQARAGLGEMRGDLDYEIRYGILRTFEKDAVLDLIRVATKNQKENYSGPRKLDSGII